jgi:predicted nucleic acid-binding protein
LRFVDASVFLHAYLVPRKSLPPAIETLKGNARAIVKRVAEGEEVATSLVHISEVANILEARTTLQITVDILSGLFALRNLLVLQTSKGSYESAVEDSRAHNIGVNDALAFVLMKKEGISEVYSFDKDFDKLKSLKRVAE